MADFYHRRTEPVPCESLVHKMSWPCPRLLKCSAPPGDAGPRCLTNQSAGHARAFPALGVIPFLAQRRLPRHCSYRRRWASHV